MNWIDVADSSTIRRLRWDKGTLEVEFSSGQTYQYFDVPEHTFVALRGADSKGSFLSQNIKGVFRYARL
jgi:hypothetical protein